MTKIYILLPVHNRRNITLLFVNCLKAQTYQNYQLILIDDGSTDGTEDAIRNQLPSVEVIKGKGDWWWAGGLQQGINWLKKNSIHPDDIVLMSNDDVSFEPDFLEKAVDILQARENLLLCSQCFCHKSGKCFDAGIKADLKSLTFSQANSLEEINCLSTMGLFLKFSDLMKIGDFYPNFLPHYLSDYEFTIRANKKGFTLHTTPEVKLWNNTETTGFREFKKYNFIAFLKDFFSKKSALNPLYWTAFTVLVSPKIWIPINLLKTWYFAIKTITLYAKHSFLYNLKKILKFSSST